MTLYPFTSDHFRRIEAAQSLEELRDVALEVLANLSQVAPMGIGMVSGPISTGGSGNKDINLTYFARYIKAWGDRGYVLFDQMPFQKTFARLLSAGLCTGRDILEKFYLPIFRSGHVGYLALMPNWRTSDGARWEHEQVLKLGLGTVYLDSSLIQNPDTDYL